MIRSMTGFGRASCSIDGREVIAELKSVNHRYLDIGFRIPRSLSFLEDTVRSIISSAISRGHIDVSLTYKNTRRDARTVSIDRVLLAEYLEAASSAAAEFNLTNDLTLARALELPDVAVITEAEDDRNAILEAARCAVIEALADLTTMREREGERLRIDLISKLDSTIKIRDKIALCAPNVVQEYKRRLYERISDMLSEVEIDRARLATEIAIYADKVGIDEELVRLKSHIDAMLAMLDISEPIGRKLDFIVQEINREFNTIGSKANDNAIAALVIDGKAEIEKIREQIQNIE